MKNMELQLMAGVPFSAGLLIRRQMAGHGIYFCVICEILPKPKAPTQVLGAWLCLN